MKNISIKINNEKIIVLSNWTIYKAAGIAGIKIPTLCYCPEFSPTSVCRMCSVEVLGNNFLMPACSTPVFEGMEVLTNSPVVENFRKTNLSLMYYNGHFGKCGVCLKKNNCQLLRLVMEYKAIDSRFKFIENKSPQVKKFNVIFDPAKCIKCRTCIAVCKKYGSDVIHIKGWGKNIQIIPPGKDCIGCEQCAWNCPVGAIYLAKDKRDL